MSPLENKEFNGPKELTDMDRRDFMRYMGLFSSMTLLSHCSKQAEKIIPFPKEISEFNGKNYEFYASTFTHQGFGQGVIVKSYEGRPIKIEGNPLHGSSFGSTSAQAQFSLYDLYHPDRLKESVWFGKKISTSELEKKLQSLLENHPQGKGLALIAPALHSPTQTELISNFQKKYPESKWITLSPWKKSEFTTYYFTEALNIISFDEDLFSGRADSLKLSRDFMKRRISAAQNGKSGKMNYLRVYQSSPTLLGAKADETQTLSQNEIWNEAISLRDDLRNNKSSIKNLDKTVVIISRELHPDSYALEMEINSLLGSKLTSTEVFSLPDNIQLSELKESILQNKITTLMTLDSNPLYWDSDWEKLFPKIKTRLTLSTFPNETVKESQIQIPLSHWLESWGDVKSFEGEHSVIQPLINPLYKSITTLSFLGMLLGNRKEDLELVKSQFKNRTWEEVLAKGNGTPKVDSTSKKNIKTNLTKIPQAANWELKILPDAFVGYGEYSQNPFLQELPKHFTRLTWNNVFSLSEQDAKELKLKSGDVIEVKTDKTTVRGPVWISSLIASKTILAHLGYGRKDGTQIEKKRGFNAYLLKNSKSISIKKTLRHEKLAWTHELGELDKSKPVKTINFPYMEKKSPPKKNLSLYPGNPLPSQLEGPQWGMTIDLTSCIGCEICVSACQVENNIPFVGEDQVKKNRILHWLRIDTYLSGKNVFFQPVPCMHCEKAPCEVVCPVNATVHGDGGLNEMIYNRCVGTRYCSNNCPYKVRRFNFKAYSVLKSPWHLGFNPEVSVRNLGVMEKCSYCIQRIKEGERTKSKVKTACQEICPTEAILFDDLKDKTSLMVKAKDSIRNYDLLEEEGTKPRTSYLKVIRLHT